MTFYFDRFHLVRYHKRIKGKSILSFLFFLFLTSYFLLLTSYFLSSISLFDFVFSLSHKNVARNIIKKKNEKQGKKRDKKKIILLVVPNYKLYPLSSKITLLSFEEKEIEGKLPEKVKTSRKK